MNNYSFNDAIVSKTQEKAFNYGFNRFKKGTVKNYKNQIAICCALRFVHT